jgi:hypothetical protein
MAGNFFVDDSSELSDSERPAKFDYQSGHFGKAGGR